MYKLAATLMLPIGLLLNASAYAEEGASSYAPLEMVEVTIRMTGGHPYGELRPCPECPARLLPLTPDAQLYINGKRTSSSTLQDGQRLIGTVFLSSSPIDAIREIVAK